MSHIFAFGCKRYTELMTVKRTLQHLFPISYLTKKCLNYYSYNMHVVNTRAYSCFIHIETCAIKHMFLLLFKTQDDSFNMHAERYRHSVFTTELIDIQEVNPNIL